jgi:hypothetical protein
MKNNHTSFQGTALYVYPPMIGRRYGIYGCNIRLLSSFVADSPRTSHSVKVKAN